MQRIRVSIVVKRVNNCPQIGRNFHVKLKWGKSRLLGMHEEQTSAVICKDRAVVWDQKFEREVQVYLEGSAPEPNDIAERERLIKKQPSSAFLRMSLRQDSERSFGSHTRYGFVEQNLVEWAWDIGDGDTHRQGMLVYGTNNASHLEVEVRTAPPLQPTHVSMRGSPSKLAWGLVLQVAISWVGQTQPILQTIDTPRASFESANTPHSHSNGDKKSLRFSAATTKGAHRPDKIMVRERRKILATNYPNPSLPFRLLSRHPHTGLTRSASLCRYPSPAAPLSSPETIPRASLQTLPPGARASTWTGAGRQRGSAPPQRLTSSSTWSTSSSSRRAPAVPLRPLTRSRKPPVAPFCLPLRVYDDAPCWFFMAAVSNASSVSKASFEILN